MSKTLKFISIFVPILLILTGIALGAVALKSLWLSAQNLECFCPSCPETEFSKKGAASLGLIKADIQGAIKKPGVYQLEVGQSLADLLVLAGGFSKEADQEYVAKTFNLAKELNNEDKIYVPFSFERQNSSSTSASLSPTVTSGSNSTLLISINTASNKELQSISGVGEVRAQAIVDNRPYSRIEELVEKGVLSTNLLESIKAKISL